MKFFELGKKNGMDWLPVKPKDTPPLLDGEQLFYMIYNRVQGKSAFFGDSF